MGTPCYEHPRTEGSVGYGALQTKQTLSTHESTTFRNPTQPRAGGAATRGGLR